MRVSRLKDAFDLGLKKMFYAPQSFRFWKMSLLQSKIQHKALNIKLHFLNKGIKQLHSQKIGQIKVCSHKVRH